MKRQVAIAWMLMLALFAPVAGQRPAPTPSQQQQNTPADEVVRITTNLVQVDAVVVDKDGRPATDLQAEDFEILEEGRPQPITNFSFISTSPPATTSPAAAATIAPPAGNKKGTPPVPPVRLRPEQVRRTVALVVDDLFMSFGSVDLVRETLKKFVDQQMQPGDLVGIFRTRGGSGALQQFTTDKNQLHRAIRSLRWYPPPLGGFGSFEDARADYTIKQRGQGGATSFEDEQTRRARERQEDFNRESLAVGTLGTLRFVVRGLEELPGRKSVVLISNGLPIYSRAGESGRALDQMRRLVDLANRASVVIYTMDARGLTDPGFITAADEVLPENTQTLRNSRINDFFESQNGLNYLADATGGLFMHSANDLNKGLRRVLEDQGGYYLIGYRPTDETFKQGSFRKISLRVKRPGLSVRSRQGFYGLTNEAVRPKPRTGDSQLYAVLASPLGAGGIRTRLTSLFGNDQRSGSFMRSLLHINAQDIAFTDEPNGWKKLVLDVAAVTFGENGQIVDEFNRTHTVRIGPDTFQHIQQYGLIYSADVPAKKPGAYQLRIVVRDGTSKRIGSASQYIEVPDLKRNALALSGILLTEANPNGMTSLPPSGSAVDAISPAPSSASAGVRRFRPGIILSYAHLIYNPRLDRTTGKPQLTTQVKLFRDGKEILTGPETPFDVGQQADLTRLSNDGMFRLNAKAAPGDYVLQIIVNDNLAGEKRRTATQWIDFEIIE